MRFVPTLSRRKEVRGPRAEGGGVTRYLALSLAVHLAVVSFISIPLVHRVRPISAEPIYQVALIQWPASDGVRAASAGTPPREEEKPRKEPIPPEKEPEPDAVKLQEVRKKPEKPREEAKATPSEVTKAEAAPAIPGPSPAGSGSPSAAPGGSASIGPDGPVSLGMVDQPNFRHDYYLQIVMSRLAQAWVRPPGGQGVTRATIHFIIRRDGSIVQPFLQEPSGWALYDRSVDRAVQEVRQLPPLPEAYAGDQLGVTAVFQRIGDEP